MAIIQKGKKESINTGQVKMRVPKISFRKRTVLLVLMLLVFILLGGIAYVVFDRFARGRVAPQEVVYNISGSYEGTNENLLVMDWGNPEVKFSCLLTDKTEYYQEVHFIPEDIRTASPKITGRNKIDYRPEFGLGDNLKVDYSTANGEDNLCLKVILKVFENEVVQ